METSALTQESEARQVRAVRGTPGHFSCRYPPRERFAILAVRVEGYWAGESTRGDLKGGSGLCGQRLPMLPGPSRSFC